MTAPGRHRKGGRHRVDPHTLTRVWAPPKRRRRRQGVGERWAGPVLLVLVFAVLVLASPEPSHRSSSATDSAGSGVFPAVTRPAPEPAPEAVPAARVVPRVVSARAVPLAEVLPVVDPATVAGQATQPVVPVAHAEGVVSSVRPRPYVPPAHTRPTTPVPPTSSVPPTSVPPVTTPPPTSQPPTPPTTTLPPVLCTTGQETTQ